MSNWRHTQGTSGGAVGDTSMESSDWRSQLQADSRQRILNRMCVQCIYTLKSFLTLKYFNYANLTHVYFTQYGCLEESYSSLWRRGATEANENSCEL